MTPTSLRRRGKNRPRLTTLQKLDIADRIIRGCEPANDLAKEYRLHLCNISQIVSKVRKNPKVLKERIIEDAEKELKDEELASYIRQQLNEGKMI